MKLDNQVWARKTILKVDPSYRYRWERWYELIKNHVSVESIWLDLGCGDMAVIDDFRGQIKFSLGIDIKIPDPKTRSPFVRADINSLPIRFNSIDVVTLPFVIEHIKNADAALSKTGQIVRPGGFILIMTTNRSSPYIFLPSLLPFSIKFWLLKKIYQINTVDITQT